MKIKDLPEGTDLGGIKVRTEDGQEGYWKSQWAKGVWLTKIPIDTTGSQQLFPAFIFDLKECLEWEVIETK